MAASKVKDESVVEKVSDYAHTYMEAGVDACTMASQKAKRVGRDMDNFVRKNPWLAVGVAAGAGLAVGFLLKSRCGTKH